MRQYIQREAGKEKDAMSSKNEYKVEHMLRTRLAREAADQAVKDWAGFPQPRILRLEEVLPTETPTSRADSEAALIYRSFPDSDGGKGRKIVAFVKLCKEVGRWGQIFVELCENTAGQRRESLYAFRVVWPGEEKYPPDCPLGQGPLVSMVNALPSRLGG